MTWSQRPLSGFMKDATNCKKTLVIAKHKMYVIMMAVKLVITKKNKL